MSSSSIEGIDIGRRMTALSHKRMQDKIYKAGLAYKSPKYKNNQTEGKRNEMPNRKNVEITRTNLRTKGVSDEEIEIPRPDEERDKQEEPL